MKVIITGDIHVHNKPRERLKIYEQLFQDIYGLALTHGCEWVVSNGDLWHEKHGVNVDVLTMLYRTLFRQVQKLRWVLVRGNHEIELKSKPEQSLLSLFSGVSRVVARPSIIHAGETDLAFLPWYNGPDFIKAVKKLRDKCVSRHRVLIAHIGVEEGRISASNYYRVNQQVKIKDLLPDFFDLVLLSDYHLTQQLADNVLYLGTPIPQAHGDGETQGVWLLTINEGEPRVRDISLLHEYPQYITVTEPLRAEEINPNDYYKLRVKPEDLSLCDHLSSLPNVTIEVVADAKLEVTFGRLESIDGNDYEAVFREWAKTRKLQKDYYELGLSYLRRAQESMFAKR